MSTRDYRAAQRVIFEGPVRQQFTPIYEVTVSDHMVEWTDRIGEAEVAFAAGRTYPKRMWRMDALGQKSLIREEYM
jgi:hypothetical protein